MKTDDIENTSLRLAVNAIKHEAVFDFIKGVELASLREGGYTDNERIGKAFLDVAANFRQGME